MKQVSIENLVSAVEVSADELLAIADRVVECGDECSDAQASAALNDRRTLLLALAQKEARLIAAHALLARVSTAPVLIVDDETLAALDSYVSTQVLRAA